jgi:hypothetical protein
MFICLPSLPWSPGLPLYIGYYVCAYVPFTLGSQKMGVCFKIPLRNCFLFSKSLTSSS